MQDLITQDNDLVIQGGDFKVDVSDTQHIEHGLQAFKGTYTQWPLIGVGLSQYEKSTGSELVLKQEIKALLKQLGYNVTTLQVGFVNSELTININADASKK